MAEQLRLLEVDGRCYRSLARGSTGQQQQQRGSRVADRGEQQEAGTSSGAIAGAAAAVEAGAEASVPIHEEGGAFVARMRLDAELYPWMIGRQGSTRRRIEQGTGASISFPARGTQGPVEIRAPSAGAAARACTQVDLQVGQALAAKGPRGLDYNFFLCLPLANPTLTAALDAWRDAVLAEPGAAASGLDASCFLKPAHLHLTVAMLKLYSEEAREAARLALRALAAAAGEALGGRPLAVRLRGLACMQGDPSAMHVLYCGVHDAPDSPGSLARLQSLCAAAVQAFAAAGLLLPQDARPVKLHATLINTRYRKKDGSSGGGGGGGQQQQQQQQQQPGQQGQPGQPGQQPGQRWAERRPFDGRALLERHGGMDLGTVGLPALHISERGGASDAATSFYKCFECLPLS